MDQFVADFYDRAIASLFALTLLSACGSQDTFLAPSGIESELKSVSFAGVANTIVPVDLVISVDTSGSMATETNSVIANLQKFYDSLAKFSDTSVTLVMSGGTAKNKVLNLGAGQTLLPVQINSRDGPAILIDLLNPESSKGQSDNGIRLRDSMRSSAKPVFLFITDDDSDDFRNAPVLPPANWYTEEAKSIWADTALSELTRLLGKAPSINGIIGHKNVEVSGVADCATTAPNGTGTFYIKTAAASGGKNWSICTEDYTQLFGEIALNIKKSLDSTYNLPADFRFVKSISIDGRVLADSEYTISAKMLVLSPTLVNSLSSGSKIKLDYI